MTLRKSQSPYGYKMLLVYKKADELQAACASLTSRFPHSKTLYSLADQMDRSARSVKQNIVEGWKRNSTREYYDFLGFSMGANAELEEDCDDIIKGRYKGMEWGKGEEREEKGQGAAGARRPPQRETTSSLSTPSSHWTLDEVERLPFYPLDTRLPPVVQLKLRCKEINMLLEKLQKSLEGKMTAEHGLSLADKLNRSASGEKKSDELLARMIEEEGFIKLPNGRIVKREE
jgi:four helix bundle protein